ncbi:luminal binding protein [Coniophora puteana RWD-64-598 SS2]|uniref:Luminal binding protein n=1 Tax=Coniophora puteana (strain RWD-64-598) TaxID=741705 RepID=A0A5M3MTN3_CONPW|nr:luminal binding protein [Coniophora puteana RWD-64-598 SS2]EIW81901.1 luminal binding protein [Coniophora puteana RWD-64-598 SS2]
MWADFFKFRSGLRMLNLKSGKSESITITNEKGRLSKEDVERMVREAEEFASEDESNRRRNEALNSLSSFVYGLKSQLADQSGLGGKLEDDNKKALLDAIKDTTDWIDEYGQMASTEDLEEKLSEVQSIVSPITSKLYAGGESSSGNADDDDYYGHDEL